MPHLLLFYCTNGYMNAPHCYVIRTLPALLVSYRPRPCSPVRDYQDFGIAYCLHLECWKYQVGDSAVSQHNLNIQFSVSFVKHDAMKKYENVRAKTTAQRIPNFNTRQA